MFPAVRIKGAPQDRERNDGDPLYEVRIIDNDYNTYQEVIDITMLALGVSEEEAYAVAWEVDHRGSCVVAEGTLSEAESVASVIRTIGIEVCVERIVDRGNC
jgi:ATP-dependent Clp protease adapter protein ClpS